MRTMLIPTILLLFCPLILCQIPGSEKIESCGNIYSCFVPSNCLVNDMDSENSQGKRAVMVLDYLQVNNNCPALFRLHSFTSSWAQISIESFEPTTKSIIFRQELKDGSATEFSCTKYSNGKVEAKYAGAVKEIIPNHSALDRAKDKLQCTFVIKKNEPIFKFDSPETNAQFIIETTRIMSTKTGHFFHFGNYFCDVSLFLFKKEAVADKKITKVISKPGHYYCEDSSISQMEYKLKSSTTYHHVTTIECELKHKIQNEIIPAFNVNGKTIENRAPFEIRCVADARFFCDHEIKNHPDEQPLQKTLAIREQKIPGELKCPAGHPYLFVDGKLILKPEFECRSYGGTEYWTVIQRLDDKSGESTNKSHRLTPKGPVVYCAKTIQCFHKYRIPDSSVKKGTLDAQNLPLCYDHGVLYVANDEVTNKRCDHQTGDFKYELKSMKGTERIVTADTKFECRYSVIDDEAQNMIDNAALVTAGAVAIALCIAVVVASVIGMVFLSRRHIKKMNLKHEKESYEKFRKDELAYKHHAYAKDEKLKMKMDAGEVNEGANGDDEKEEEPTSAPCADPTLWSDQVMDFCCETEKRLMPTNYWDKELTGMMKTPVGSQDQALKNEAKNFKLKSDVKITEYLQPREYQRMTEFTAFQEKFLKAKAEGLKR